MSASPSIMRLKALNMTKKLILIVHKGLKKREDFFPFLESRKMAKIRLKSSQYQVYIILYDLLKIINPPHITCTVLCFFSYTSYVRNYMYIFRFYTEIQQQQQQVYCMSKKQFPVYKVSYYIEWVTTSRTYSRYKIIQQEKKTYCTPKSLVHFRIVSCYISVNKTLCTYSKGRARLYILIYDQEVETHFIQYLTVQNGVTTSGTYSI